MGGGPALPAPPPQVETKDGVGSIPVRALAICAVVGVFLLGAVGYLVLGNDSAGGGQMLTSPGGAVLSQSEKGPGKTPESKPRWNEDVVCEAVCTVAADDRAIYVLSNTDFNTVGSAADYEYGEAISGSDDDDNTLTAFDGSSGKELWSQDVTGSALSGVIDGHVLVYDTAEGEVVSYDPQTGDKEWRADGSWTQFRVGSNLILSQYDGGDSSVSMSVINMDDGKTVWSEDGYPAGACGGTVYMVDGDDVVARDAGTGDERWTTRAEDGVSASCSSEGVFIAADGEVSSLDPGNGKERWTQKIKGALSVYSGDGVVVVGTDDEVLGLSPKDGEEQWSQDLADWGQVAGFIPAGKGRAIRSGEDGEDLVLFDLKTGEEIESHRAPGAATALTPDRIYLLDEGEVVALTLRSLEEVWTFDGDEDASDIVVGGGRAYLLSETEISAHW